MTRVKICGIRTLDDARFCCSAGADAVGFIAVRASKRYVTPDQYREVALALPPLITPVVVAETIADALAYDPVCIQYYGGSDDAPDGMRTIRALRPQRPEDLDDISAHERAGAFLIDAYHPDHLGGTGTPADWDLYRCAVERTSKPVILSGGLTAETVGAAVESLAPHAVDVASGVEVSPGVKDLAKVLEFIHAVRAAERLS